MTNNQLAFLALVRAGLWEQDARLLPYDPIDFNEVYSLAEEQSVLGIVAAGLEHVSDLKIAKENVLTFVGYTLQLEQRNQSMNAFISEIVEKLRKYGVYTILIKGQGIAQCYERPLWRSCGDVDFLLSNDNYEKAKDFLSPLANSVASENSYSQHLGIMIAPWTVELHGNLRCGLSNRIDKGLDGLMNVIFYEGNVRSWNNGKTQVFLPGVDVDVIYIFTHILQHFYKGGIGIRQVCDLCRFLWYYRSKLDTLLLEKRLKNMGLITEWKAFGAFAVEYLGMPEEAYPLFSMNKKWKRKGKHICSFLIEVGNFGHNRDMSYHSKPFIVRKVYSMTRRLHDSIRHFRLFPLDSCIFIESIFVKGIKAAFNNKRPMSV